MNRMRSLGVGHSRRTVLASFFVTLLISLKPIRMPAQEVCDFDSLASDVAGRNRESVKRVTHRCSGRGFFSAFRVR
jgi:hypothetical protein